MSWNDGISRAMDKYFNETLAEIPDVAIDSIKQGVDSVSEKFFKEVYSSTPVKTGGLQCSFVQTKIDTPSYYGTISTFAGTDSNGVPYEKIANTLNYGTKDCKINPKYFLTNAVRKLKTLDKDIDKLFDKKMEELDKRS